MLRQLRCFAAGVLKADKVSAYHGNKTTLKVTPHGCYFFGTKAIINFMRSQRRFSEDIIDYIKWRGDIKITEEYSINEADYLILARIAYFPFQHIALAPRESVKSFSDKMLALRRNYFNIAGDHDMVVAISQAPRYQNIIVTDYVNRSDRKVEKQFGAATIHLPNNEICVSYLGTDATLVGWKEDFNMTFISTIPSQEMALEYLERIAAKYPNHKIRVCGHSKGGNIAVFAALSAKPELQKRIIDVINFDGPGFVPDFVRVKFHRSAEMLAKVHNYIPQGSMIGRLLQQDGDRTVVFSREDGLYQHDIYSWQISGTEIVRAAKTSDSSEIFNQATIDLLKARSLEERRIFINTVYDIICGADFSTMDDLRSSWLKKLPNLIKSYRDVKPEDRDLVLKIVRQIISLYFGTRRQYLDNKKPTRRQKSRAIKANKK